MFTSGGVPIFDGFVQITSNLKNTVTGMKAIIGKKFHSADVQMEMDLVGFRMVDVAGKVGCPVMYNDEEILLTPERAMAMLMKCLQGIAERDQGAAVTDVVVSVRSAHQRHELLVCSCHSKSLSCAHCVASRRTMARRAAYRFHRTSRMPSAVRCSTRPILPA